MYSFIGISVNLTNDGIFFSSQCVCTMLPHKWNQYSDLTLVAPSKNNWNDNERIEYIKMKENNEDNAN